MTKRQLTDQSSPADVAEAQQQLSNANRDLDNFIDAAKRNPATPREIDPETGQELDFPFISVEMINNAGKRIANRYDYIEYGKQDFNVVGPSSDSLSVNIGGEKFYIRGSTDVNSRPGRNYFEIDDAGVPDDPAIVAQPSGDISNPNTPAESNVIYGNVPIRDQFANTEPGEFSPDPSVPGAANQPPGENVVTENNDDSSRDDNTGVAEPGDNGTGRSGTNADDSGTEGISSNTGDSGVIGTPSSSVDVDRLNLIPGETALGGTAVGAVTNRTDIATQAAPVRDSAGKISEDNIAGRLVRSNPLHKISSWSYELSLYLLTPGDWNNISRNGGVDSNQLKNLMMKSGGHGGKSVLNPSRDYYIDNLEFSAAVGQSSESTKNANNFNIKFQIIEPYGVAMIAEIIEMCNNLGVEDYVQAPYLIRIQFNGYDNNGNFVKNIPSTGPKYIPIKISGIDFAIDSSATIYTIEAVPYAHWPLEDETTRALKQDIDIEGQTYEELVQETINKINADEEASAEENGSLPDVYDFVIHDEEMKSAKVGYTLSVGSSGIQLSKQSFDNDSKDKEKHSIAASSLVKDTLVNLIHATDYLSRYNVTADAGGEADRNDAFNLIKVIPTVEFISTNNIDDFRAARNRGESVTAYDTQRNRYQRKITYKIEKQPRYGESGSGMPSASVERAGWVKEYEWIFTGKNDNILDFSVEYNLDYFNLYTAFSEEKGKQSNTPSAAGPGVIRNTKTKNEAPFEPGAIPRYTPLMDLNSTPRSPQALRAADHMDNILNQPRANQLQLTMEIIGDSDYIIQDRSVLPKGIEKSTTGKWYNDSLAMDTQDVIIDLKFRTPRDYNPENGTMDIETSQTFIQGKYRLLFVTSKFSEGQFTQTLELNRIPKQLANDGTRQPSLVDEPSFLDETDDARSDRTNTTDLDPEIQEAIQLEEDFEDIRESRPNTTPTVNNITLEMENALQILSTDLSPENVSALDAAIPENTGPAIRQNLVNAIDNYYSPADLVEATLPLAGDLGFSVDEQQGAQQLLDLRTRLLEGL